MSEHERKPDEVPRVTPRVDSYETVDWSQVDILTDEEKTLPLASTDPKATVRVVPRVDSYEELDWSDVDILTDEEKLWPLATTGRRKDKPEPPPAP